MGETRSYVVPRESQQTVWRWIEETFPGGDPESPRKSLRLLEEVVELCLACGATPQQICDIAWAELGRDTADGLPSTDPAKVAAEAADVQILLYGLAGLRGFDLAEEVDRKMAINRERRWMPCGDGTGYHVRD